LPRPALVPSLLVSCSYHQLLNNDSQIRRRIRRSFRNCGRFSLALDIRQRRGLTSFPTVVPNSSPSNGPSDSPSTVPRALSSGSPSASPSAYPNAVTTVAPRVSRSADPGSDLNSKAHNRCYCCSHDPEYQCLLKVWNAKVKVTTTSNVTRKILSLLLRCSYLFTLTAWYARSPSTRPRSRSQRSGLLCWYSLSFRDSFVRMVCKRSCFLAIFSSLSSTFKAGSVLSKAWAERSPTSSSFSLVRILVCHRPPRPSGHVRQWLDDGW
jgi:hypothetical protein